MSEPRNPQAQHEAQYLREVVPVMRELGVLVHNGITLGPEPTKLERMKRLAETSPDLVDRAALEEEKRRQRLEDARQEVRDKLGITDDSVDVDRFLNLDMVK